MPEAIRTSRPPVKGLVLYADSSRQPEARDFAGLADYQAAVGGYIESVRCPDPIVMYVNEEGLLMHLPPNHFASIVAQRLIVGDVVLVGPTDQDGYDTDLDPDVAETLLGGGDAV
jgi:hypothetical protein